MYYSESIEKDTTYREEYSNTIKEFLFKEHKKAEENQKEFMSPKDYFSNTEKYRKEFINFLGFPINKERVLPKLLEKKFVTTDGNVNIYRMQFLFLNKIKFYGIFFEQTENPKQKPFLLGLHGGDGTAEMISSIHLNSANYRHMVRRATDRGANVFVPQLLLWQVERYGNPFVRSKTDAMCRQLGGSITALELYLLQGSIDYFLQVESMNQELVGAIGLSYGGMYALHISAIDTRIKACYSSSWVCDSFALPQPDWSFLNSDNTFSVAKTGALVCPRALVVGMGTRDALFPYKDTEKQCQIIEKYYKEFKKEDNFKLVIFDGTHEVNPNDDEFDFFFEKLYK
jgi:hypothetical protein